MQNNSLPPTMKATILKNVVSLQEAAKLLGVHPNYRQSEPRATKDTFTISSGRYAATICAIFRKHDSTT